MIFPSLRSRNNNFFLHSLCNRFWDVNNFKSDNFNSLVFDVLTKKSGFNSPFIGYLSSSISCDNAD